MKDGEKRRTISPRPLGGDPVRNIIVHEYRSIYALFEQQLRNVRAFFMLHILTERLCLDFINETTQLNYVMSGSSFSSHELLKSTGVVLDCPDGTPPELRNVMISAVLACMKSSKFLAILNEKGWDVSERTVGNWLQSTRVWLGLPRACRGKLSRKFQRSLEDWHQVNGYPSLDEIDSGWIPAHRMNRKREEGCGFFKGHNADCGSVNEQDDDAKAVSLPKIQSESSAPSDSVVRRKLSEADEKHLVEFRLLLNDLVESIKESSSEVQGIHVA